MAATSVAVVVPIGTLELSSDERVSFRQLRHVLAGYDTYLVLPDDLDGTLDGLPVKRVASRYFRGPKRNNQPLMMSPELYDAFSAYDFVLIYQLDSLVLSDELQSWCEEAWDNIGAPWTRRAADGTLLLTGVGNGGFALRRVESCVRVGRLARRPVPRLRTLIWFGAPFARRLVTHLPRTIRKIATSSHKARTTAAILYGALASTRSSFMAEDKFWSEMAPRLDPTFRIPPPERALSFAFETNPRECFELNGQRLPFGCHKWWGYDRDFWEPHLMGSASGTDHTAT